MAGHLTTHVLDVARGRPAGGVTITVCLLEGSEWRVLKTVRTNSDGRVDGSLLSGEEMVVGRYELLFAVGDYFAEQGLEVADPPFLDQVPIRFGIADASAHYHVPLLVSPWAYSTYRGS